MDVDSLVGSEFEYFVSSPSVINKLRGVKYLSVIFLDGWQEGVFRFESSEDFEEFKNVIRKHCLS